MDNPLADRIPPQNLEAERAVLGAMMLDRESALLATDLLDADKFYSWLHRSIFIAMQALMAQNKSLDALTITDQNPELEATAIHDIMTQGSPAHVEHYAMIVKDHAIRRAIIKKSSHLVEAAFDVHHTTEDLLSDVEKVAGEVSLERVGGELRSNESVIQNVLLQLETDYQPRGVMTGFRDYDHLTHGLQPASLNIIAGLPSMGKSSFALNLAVNLGKSQGVGIISIEDTHENIVRRMLSRQSGVSIHPGQFTAEREVNAITTAATEMQDFKIFIDESASQTLLSIASRARQLKAYHGIKLLIVDYIQLITVPKSVDARDRVNQVSTGLKRLAKELDIPIIILSQFSREATKADRPKMYHLKETSQLEQDADTILIIHSTNQENDPREVICTVDKNRNGPLGEFTLYFHASLFCFSDSEDGPERCQDSVW